MSPKVGPGPASQEHHCSRRGSTPQPEKPFLTFPQNTLDPNSVLEFWEKIPSSVWAVKFLPLLANEATFRIFNSGPVLHFHLICSNLPDSLTSGVSSGPVSDAPPGDAYDSPSKQLQG